MIRQLFPFVERKAHRLQASSVREVQIAEAPSEPKAGRPGRALDLALLPSVLVLALWIGWTATDGGYFPTDWYPAAIGTLALAMVVALASGRALPSPVSVRVAVAALCGLVAWSFLSIVWADSPGAALDAATKLVAITAGVWLLTLLPWREASALAFGAAWSLAVGVVGLVGIVSAAGAEGADLAGRFVEGRWLDPLGYPNASAALAAMAIWPALAASARRGVPALAQAALLALVALLVELALLPQSRGAVLGLAFATPIFVGFTADRLRVLARLAVVAIAALVAIGPLYDVYDAAFALAERLPGESLTAVMDDAVRAVLVTVAATAVGGLVIALAERRVTLSETSTRRIRLGVAGLAVLVAVVALAFAATRAGDISDAVSDRIDTVTTVPDEAADDGPVESGARLTSNFSELRADYWRVALDTFGEAPLLGAGAGNYELNYTQERELAKPSRYAHDIWLRFMADGGLVGLLLLLAAFGASAFAVVAAWRRADGAGRTLLAAGAATIAYFAVHASVDWLEEFPLLATAAFGLPLMAVVAVTPRLSGAPSRSGGSRAHRVAAFAATGVGIAVLIVLCAAYLSVRYVERGTERAAVPAAAIEDLDRAADLNPLSTRPLVRKGAIAYAAGRPSLAEDAFRDALEIEDSWYPHFELALLASERYRGRNRIALAHIRRAAELNPNEAVVKEVRAQLASGRHVERADVYRKLRAVRRDRFTTPAP